MNFRKICQTAAPVMGLSLFLLVGCGGGGGNASRWDEAEERTTDREEVSREREEKKKISGKPVNGSQLNKFFPKGSSGFKTTPAQEKRGFALHNLKQKGKTVAALSINDAANNPSLLDKFEKGSQKKIKGYPAVVQGKSTSVLVGDRYQVKVLSKASSFTAKDRSTWIGKFNLQGLSRLK